MQIQGITAQVKPGDPGPGDVHADFAEVTITLDGDREVSFVIHQSKVYSNTINVEIDGDLIIDDPSLRINLNDCLLFDSTANAPEIESPREPDMGDPDVDVETPSEYRARALKEGLILGQHDDHKETCPVFHGDIPPGQPLVCTC